MTPPQLPSNKRAKYFKWACIGEGITCVLLYLIGMPLKYEWEIIWPMIPIGSLHGAFFTYYLITAFLARPVFKWDDEDFVFVIIAAFFPFATFWIERNFVKDKNSETKS